MNDNTGFQGVSAGGAEGGTLSRGELEQPNQAAPGRFPKSACHKLANGASAHAGAEDGRDGSSVQCERNGAGVQWPAQALDAARSWARDWLDVYGAPTALWELVLRFAALVAMSAGEKRRLDDAHTVGLFEGEPGAMLWCNPEPGAVVYRPLALVLPFGTSAFGSASGVMTLAERPRSRRAAAPLPRSEVAELEALLRGAIERVEALHAEAEFLRHATTLIRGDGFSDRWTAGADFRDMAGVPLEEPHPDAYRFSLAGALRQAWAERGGSGPVPRAYVERVLRLELGDCVDAWRTSEKPLGMLLDVLRTVNDQRDPRSGMMQTAKSALELLMRAALAADAEAESEVL